jgi:MFS family permease
MIDTTPSVTSPSTLYSPRYKNLVLALLVLAYTFNFIDRTIIATIGQAIKLDLKISDTQLGLLGGLYFALLYTLLGIPIARIAERSSRVSIITWAIVIWSVFTALCGMAANFAQLALFRFGVGVGEAGLTPPAHSLISDYFEAKKRASALSVYSFGLPLGVMFGAVLGGWLAQNYSWRIAFMAVGLPGVFVAVAIKLLIQEPPRGHSEVAAPATPGAEATARAAPALAAELKELGVVTRAMLAHKPVLHMSLGITVASIGSFGSGSFVPAYFIRTFGLTFTQVGLITGLVSGFSSGVGTLLGGFVADRLARRDPRWYALTPAIGLAIAAPLYITAYLQDSWKTAAFILLLPGIFHYTYMGPTFGVLQNAVETHRRATAVALLLFFLNLIALGGGAPLAGWVIDHFAAFNHAHPGVNSLAASLGGFFSTDTQAFQVACPGGVAPAGSAADAVSLCAGSTALGTRQGILLMLCFYFWAALHYLLASLSLARK